MENMKKYLIKIMERKSNTIPPYEAMLKKSERELQHRK
jgi:hypothetical protein